MRRAWFAALVMGLLATLVVISAVPVIADTKSSETLTVAITDGNDAALFTITFTAFRDDSQYATATWTSFQRGLTIAGTAIPPATPVPLDTATLRGLAPDIRKRTALVASAYGGLGQPLRR